MIIGHWYLCTYIKIFYILIFIHDHDSDFWTDRYKKAYTTKNMVKSVKSTKIISRNNFELVA